jgi:ABC-type multidrug transport system fused ATPase/permease subunit
MTRTDVDRVSDFSVWVFSIYDAPMEILIGTIFLYSLIGYAALLGLSVAILFVPLNNWTSKGFIKTQDKLMSARDRRVTLMNEVLSSIRMIRFYAFEKPFEQRVLKAREEELKQMRTNFFLEVSFQGCVLVSFPAVLLPPIIVLPLLHSSLSSLSLNPLRLPRTLTDPLTSSCNSIWAISPICCVLFSFWAYTSPLLMGQKLTPSVAFASLAVWNELKFSLNIIP